MKKGEENQNSRGERSCMATSNMLSQVKKESKIEIFAKLPGL